MTNTLVLKLKVCTSLKQFFSLCAGQDTIFFILNNIAVLAGNNFLSLTAKRKEKEIGLENFANYFL